VLSGEKGKKGNTLNNLFHVHFPLKYETLPFLDITQLLTQGKQQSYRFLERSASKPVVYSMSKKYEHSFFVKFLLSVAHLFAAEGRV
jgi:hypothetical protein